MVALPIGARAQSTPAAITRGDAVRSALARGARLAVARADTSTAWAALLSAQALENPALSASYSKSQPNYHVALDFPLDALLLRGRRISAAGAGRQSAQLRYAFEVAAAQLEADTTYTRALAALELGRLSRRNALAADTLLRMAVLRRDAGDASELDVQLATINAGQAENTAASDSLTYLSTLLDLQGVMGLPASDIQVVPADSLTLPAGALVSDSLRGVPLSVAAAQLSLQAADITAALQRRAWLSPFSLSLGFETGDATDKGLLPTVGFAVPLPLFNRGRAAIAQSAAERERARAEFALAQVTSRTEIARAQRERALSLSKVQRDQQLVTSANRVAAMSITAYREGASTLPNVLEAQRNAREVLSQYINDLADAWIAIAELRVLTLTSPGTTP
ncbi:MAG: outer rane efflux protein [Gemmatimonadetes bacterium]|nr:outer rane efflux protein [Gemmatimonadota bacterium]